MDTSATNEDTSAPSADHHTTSGAVHHIVDVVDRLGTKLINLLGWVLFLTFLAFAVFVGSYYVILFEIPVNDERRSPALTAIREIMLSVWDKILPIGVTALRVVAPIIILLLAIGILLTLARRGATPFDLSRVLNDFPSLLALLIVITICLLPLAGLPVPDVLNNVALVVVGFYFGKKVAPGA